MTPWAFPLSPIIAPDSTLKVVSRITTNGKLLRQQHDATTDVVPVDSAAFSTFRGWRVENKKSDGGEDASVAQNRGATTMDYV